MDRRNAPNRRNGPMQWSVLIAALSLAIGAGQPAAWAQSQDWDLEIVDYAGRVEALAFASDGTPAIAYGKGGIYFARFDGDAWLTEFVANGEDADLIHNPLTGQPILAFVEEWDVHGIYLAHRVSSPDGASSWDIELFDEDGSGYIALAFSPAHQLSIAYSVWRRLGGNPKNYRSYTYDVWFAQWDESRQSWEKQSLGQSGGVTDLAFDSFGNPIVAYITPFDEEGKNGLNVARWNALSWDIETAVYPVDGGVGLGSGCLVVNPATGIPTVAFVQEDFEGGPRAKIASRVWPDWSVPGDWAADNYHDHEWAGAFPSLAYDSAGMAHIAHIYPMQVTHRINESWRTEMLEDLDARYPRLAVNPLDDTLAVSFVKDGWLLFAQRTSTDYGNFTPSVAIISPPDGEPFNTGVSIPFAATAEDAEEGDLAGDLVWTSDLDGEIGTGPSFSAVLMDGTHLITATAADSTGKTGMDSISITVGTQPSLYVGQIDMDVHFAVWPKSYVAYATIAVVSDSGTPDDATVVGDWYYKTELVSSGSFGMTDAIGVAVIQSPIRKSKSGDVFTFVVTDIVKDGYVYDSASNAETQDSVAVP